MTTCSGSLTCLSSDLRSGHWILWLIVLTALPAAAQLRHTVRAEPWQGRTLSAAASDTTGKQSNWSRKWNMEHSPLKATVMAAVLPGAGQVYNRKYWKLPILYAGMGTCVYFIADNTREYRKWRDSYIAANDGDPATVPAYDPAKYRLDYAQDLYRRWTELSYMALLGVYILQVIDANVDAHLFYFDVSPDLSLQIHPSLLNTGRAYPGIGISLRM
jgi:hypothetical protein